MTNTMMSIVMFSKMPNLSFHNPSERRISTAVLINAMFVCLSVVADTIQPFPDIIIHGPVYIE